MTSRDVQYFGDDLEGIVSSIVKDIAVLIDTGHGPATTVADRVFAITGPRGGGKTTALASIRDRLASERNCLVLPIAQPELFSRSDSVINVFLASMWEWLTAKMNLAVGGLDEHALVDLLRKLNDSARTNALSMLEMSTSFEPKSKHRGADADDVVTSARASARLISTIQEMVNHVRYATFETSESKHLIVLPVDDADLAFGNLSEILQELRLLSTIEGIAIVTCFNRDDIFDLLLNEWRQALPLIEEGRARSNVNQQLLKIFPLRRRFALPTLSLEERAQFVPMGDESFTPLKSLLTAFESRFGQPDNRVGYALTADSEAGQLYSPLPANPRRLTQIWQSLHYLGSESTREDQSLRLAASRIAQILSEDVSGVNVADVAEAFSASPRARRRAVADLFRSHYVGCATTDPFSDTSAPSRIRVQFRNFSRVRSWEQSESSSRDSQQPRRNPVDLPSEQTSAILAIQELALSFPVELLPRASIGMAEFTFLQQVTLHGLSTDNRFFGLPNAYTLSVARLTVDAWNLLTQLHLRNNFSTIELCAALMTTSSKFVASNVAPTAEDLLAGARTPVLESFEFAARRFVTGQYTSSVLELSFADWFRYQLPALFHESILPSATLRAVIPNYLRALSDAPLQKVLTEQETTLDHFDARVERILSAVDDTNIREHSWLAGYFLLASALRSTNAGPLSGLSDAWAALQQASSTGAIVLQSSRSSARGDRAMAPYETAAGTSQLEAALRRLTQIREKVRSGELLS